MKALGIVRKLDDLGRITLPIELRRTFKIEDNAPLEIYVEGDVICLKPCKLQCVCCGSINEDKLVELNGVLVCGECARELYGKVPYSV